MRRLSAIFLFLSVIVLLLGGCAYYYPYDYDTYYSPPDNYGFIEPYYYYSPYGYYSFYPYPYSYPYGPYGAYYDYYPYPPYYLGESPEGFTERQFEPAGKPGDER